MWPLLCLLCEAFITHPHRPPPAVHQLQQIADLLRDTNSTASARGPRPTRVVRELWSRDAGAYYCNEVYFRTLTRTLIKTAYSDRAEGGVFLSFW